MSSEKSGCFETIEGPIKNRSKNCKNLSNENFIKAYLFSGNSMNENKLLSLNKSVMSCARAITKYKPRIKACGAEYSLRDQQKINRIKKLYNINKIFESINYK